MFYLRDFESLGSFGAVGGCVGFVWCNVQVSVSLRSLILFFGTYALRNVRNTLPLAVTFGILKNTYFELHCRDTFLWDFEAVDLWIYINTRSSSSFVRLLFIRRLISRLRKGFTISMPLFVHNTFFFAPSLLFEDTTFPKLIHACESEEAQKREIANTVGADPKQEFEFIRHLRVSTIIKEREGERKEEKRRRRQNGKSLSNGITSPGTSSGRAREIASYDEIEEVTPEDEEEEDCTALFAKDNKKSSKLGLCRTWRTK
ncbi:hypothetical protein G5I_05096 [Acromyrmex echinatior]|uniref:Uncharacterized protein n=1 Tax=Acromyrmex echinatior TaxID=103372 RepID=F4WHD6_ACREC|nr:hypothetical protein G5I_05096 [Acromyrmex echinatior]